MKKWISVILLLFVIGMFQMAIASEVRELTAQEGEAVVEVAMEYVKVSYEENKVGIPYHWGGRITVNEFLNAVNEGKAENVGVDASGLVVSVYSQVIKDLRFRIPEGSRFVWVKDINSSMLYEWNIRPITVEELRAGDFIFFSSQSSKIGGVGIFVERVGRQINYIVASTNQNKVIYTTSNLDGSYWRDRFAGAGRLLIGMSE